MTRLCLRGALLAALLLDPLVAVAQVSVTLLAPSVETMLREGIAHRLAGRDEAAVERFEAAYAAQRAPITAGQLALACQAAGRWLDADRFMREALASPDDDWVRRHRRELDEAHAVVRRNVGELELRGGLEGATVRVDGTEVGRLPLAAPLRLRAGAVTLEVRAEAHFPFTRHVTVLGGELTRELVTLTPLPAESTPLPPRDVPAPSVIAPGLSREPARSRDETRVPMAAWVFGGVGLMLITGGVVAIGLRNASAERFNSGCPSLAEVPRDAQRGVCHDEVVLGDQLVIGAIVNLTGGVIATGVAATIALWPRRANARSSAWACAPSGIGAACAVTF